MKIFALAVNQRSFFSYCLGVGLIRTGAKKRKSETILSVNRKRRSQLWYCCAISDYKTETTGILSFRRATNNKAILFLQLCIKIILDHSTSLSSCYFSRIAMESEGYQPYGERNKQITHSSLLSSEIQILHQFFSE